jgi:hypothetical protein
LRGLRLVVRFGSLWQSSLCLVVHVVCRDANNSRGIGQAWQGHSKTTVFVGVRRGIIFCVLKSLATLHKNITHYKLIKELKGQDNLRIDLESMLGGVGILGSWL